jgi:hypothetical protein
MHFWVNISLKESFEDITVSCNLRLADISLSEIHWSVPSVPIKIKLYKVVYTKSYKQVRTYKVVQTDLCKEQVHKLTIWYHQQRTTCIVQSWCLYPVLYMTVNWLNRRCSHCIVRVMNLLPHPISKIRFFDKKFHLKCFNGVLQNLVDCPQAECITDYSTQYLIWLVILLFVFKYTSLMHIQLVEPFSCKENKVYKLVFMN